MSSVERFLPVQNLLGEGPVWDTDARVLYWVDIFAHCFYRYDPSVGTYERIDVGLPIGVLALRQGGGLVMATRDGFAFWSESTRTLDFIADPEADKPENRFNDGAVDCRGRFWAGTMSAIDESRPVGSLYRLDPDGSVHLMETGIRVSNGIGWNLDNTIMYFTDSDVKTIYAYDFDAESGSIANRRIFLQLPDNDPAVPDGLTVDSEGYIWSAFWDGARLARYAPDGSLDRIIPVPALRPTSCAFGGANLDELYITSSGGSLSEEIRTQYPLAGDLFRLKTGIKGRPDFKFAG